MRRELPRLKASVEQEVYSRLLPGYVRQFVQRAAPLVDIGIEGDLDGVFTLKPEAQLVLAKLAGILLIMPDQGALIEGHTDSTGSPDYNLDLSQRRADSVKQYLAEGGHFAEGSMGPKMRAIVQFLENGGKEALITDPGNLERAMAGETGTWIRA